METVNRRLGILLIVLFLITGLYAQDAEESRSYAVKTDDGIVIHQSITFPAVPNTSYYEVEIEQLLTTWVPELELVTEENVFDVALKAGNYRYRITSYNKMGLPEGRSEWQSFTVFPAVQPQAETYQPFYGFYYVMADPSGSITVTGKDFSVDSEFALVTYKRKSDWSGVKLENRKDVFFPDQVVISGNEATLYFSRGNLKTGNYNILIRNPGGLWTTLGQVRVGNQNKVDWIFSFGYSPLFALFDLENTSRNYDNFTNTSSQQSLDRFNPGGYYFRFGIIPLKTKIGNFGLEAQFNFLVDNYDREEWSKEPGWYSRMLYPIKFGLVSILYQYQATERWQHNVRLGTFPTGDNYHKELIHKGFGNYEYHSAEGNFWYFGLGYNAQYFIWKNLYAEAGIDLLYAHNFKISHSHFMILPTIGIGWQAGRWADWAEVTEGAARGEDYSVPVTDKPKPEFLLSLGWAPMIPLAGVERYGWDHNTNTLSSTEFIQPFNAAGFNFRFAWIPHHWRNNKLGFELEMDILRHKNYSLIEEGVPIGEMMLGVRYQRVLNDAWQLNVRAAAGFSDIYAYSLYQHWEYADYATQLGFKFGASVQYFIWRNLYVEGGLDFTLTKAPQNLDKNINSDPRIYLKPSIAIGWQFNRNGETGLRLPGLGFQWTKPKEEPSEEEPAEEGQAREEKSAFRMNWLEFLLSAGWTPLIPLNGEESLYARDPGGSGGARGEKTLNPFNPAGFGIRFAWMPFQWDRNKLGLEFEFNMVEFIGRKKNTEESADFLLLSEILFGLRLQRIITDNINLNARFAVGNANPYYFQHDGGGTGVWRPNDDTSVGVKFGGSVQYFFWRDLYGELGLDLTFVFGTKTGTNLFLRPSLAVGWQLNRRGAAARSTRASTGTSSTTAPPITPPPEQEVRRVPMGGDLE